jgi:hypothetical protein
MMKTFLTTGLVTALLALTSATNTVAQTGGKFYGVHWDGSQEHFVSLNPTTGVHTSLAVVPGVQWIDATFRVFDPDSGLFSFIGGGSNTMHYQVIDAATGAVLRTSPRNDNLKNPAYDPGTGLLYGTWWSDSTLPIFDTIAMPGRDSIFLKHPGRLKGTEYFSSINPRTGARTDTPIPGLLTIGAASHFFDSDSGRYVLYGTDTAGVKKYYIIDVTSGAVIGTMPLDFRLDFPVYNPVTKQVHGLWWSDSTVREVDSLGRIVPVHPPQIKGAEYFVTINADSSVDLVELPGVKWISNFNRALDTDSGRYVFTGKENTGDIRYYVIDVATGAILSNTAAPGRAVDHIVYAPLHSSVYAFGNGVSIASARATQTSSWSLRQGAGTAELAFTNPKGLPHSFALLDVTGKTLLRRDGIHSGRVSFGTSGLKAGVYAFRITGPAGIAASGKLVLR